MSIHSLDTPPGGYGKRSFTIPRFPAIRLWASKKFYPDSLYIIAVDDNPNDPKESCFAGRGRDIKIPLKLVPDNLPGGTGNWSTAPIGDFDLNRLTGDQKKREAFFYIGPKPDLQYAKFTLYVSTSPSELTTKFGKFAGAKGIPEPFPNNSENYFTDMSDAQGNWLWLYRLYASDNP